MSLKRIDWRLVDWRGCEWLINDQAYMSYVKKRTKTTISFDGVETLYNESLSLLLCVAGTFAVNGFRIYRRRRRRRVVASLSATVLKLKRLLQTTKRLLLLILLAQPTRGSVVAAPPMALNHR